MNIMALLIVALAQLASLDMAQLQETIGAIKTALVEQYVEPAEEVEVALERARTWRASGWKDVRLAERPCSPGVSRRRPFCRRR